MADQIEETVKKDRADMLRGIAADCSVRYRSMFVGSVLEVVPEHRNKSGIWSAHSQYFFPVYLKTDDLKKNCPVTVCVRDVFGDGVLAEINS